MMKKDKEPDLERARLDPASVFGTPERLIAHEGLSRDEKIELLRRWAYDVSELEVAEEEGMVGGESTVNATVRKLLHELTLGYDVEHSPPTKQRDA